jgi:hypothetical protein
MRAGVQYQLFEGYDDLLLVGEASYQDAIHRAIGLRSHPSDAIRAEIHAILVPEPENPYDANAVSGWINAQRVGYLSRSNAQSYVRGLEALQASCGKPVALRGVVAGGGWEAGRPRYLGVFLQHDRQDFGLRKQPFTSVTGRMDTGLSQAIAGDAADDSYDLSWLETLPDDPQQAIAQLRTLLADERDLIDRHYMFHQLEENLYKLRDIPEMLIEFDRCCEQHDAEMPSIRDALFAKWQQVPSLHVYKRMCIRLAKAGRANEGLWWAERGLQIYGGDAARPEVKTDLEKRAVVFRKKAK